MWIAKQCGCKNNPGCFDAGNGAIVFYEVNVKYPGITRVKFRSYCGRDANETWYKIYGSSADRYKTIAAAQSAIRKRHRDRIIAGL